MSCLLLLLGCMTAAAAPYTDLPVLDDRAGVDTVALAERVIQVGHDSDDPNHIFSRVVGIAAQPDGRFAVVDRGMSSVRLYDQDGSQLFARGRSGAGPGEFSPDIAGVAFGRDGSVFVLDPGSARITQYAPDGKLIGTHPLLRRREERVLEWRQREPGVVLEWVRSFADRRNVIRSRVLPSERVEEVLEFAFEEPSDGRSPDEPIELLGVRPIWTPTGREGVAWTLSAPGHPASIHLDGLEDSPEIIVAEGFDPRPMTREEAEHLLSGAAAAWAEALGRDPAAIRGLTDRFGLPDTLPALTGLHAGPQGRLLVQGFHEVEELSSLALFSYFALPLGGSKWVLLDPVDGTQGSLVGFAEDFQPMAATANRIYGVETDIWGVESVAVYEVRIIGADRRNDGTGEGSV